MSSELEQLREKLDELSYQDLYNVWDKHVEQNADLPDDDVLISELMDLANNSDFALDDILTTIEKLDEETSDNTSRPQFTLGQVDGIVETAIKKIGELSCGLPSETEAKVLRIYDDNQYPVLELWTDTTSENCLSDDELERISILLQNFWNSICNL